MVYCCPTCYSHPRSLVSLVTWYDTKVYTFFYSCHFKPLVIGILLKAAWVPGQGCVITETNNKLLAVTFIYSMAFDFVVLLLTGYKLFHRAPGHSRLLVLIFNDGLAYFVIA